MKHEVWNSTAGHFRGQNLNTFKMEMWNIDISGAVKRYRPDERSHSGSP